MVAKEERTEAQPGRWTTGAVWEAPSGHCMGREAAGPGIGLVAPLAHGGTTSQVSLPHLHSRSTCSVPGSHPGTGVGRGSPTFGGGGMAQGNKSPGFSWAWTREQRKERNPEGSLVCGGLAEGSWGGSPREFCWGQEVWGPGEPELQGTLGPRAQGWS